LDILNGTLESLGTPRQVQTVFAIAPERGEQEKLLSLAASLEHKAGNENDGPRIPSNPVVHIRGFYGILMERTRPIQMLNRLRDPLLDFEVGMFRW